jgi:hypothetical protein
VDDAVARWPELLRTGLRVGAPAVTDGGYSWIVDFIKKADAAGRRVDYVPVHYYRSYPNNDYPQGAANNLYNYLKSIYDVAKRPIWVTEFNNGANWTSDPDPTFDQNKNVIEAMVAVMDSTPWIERYAIYSAVEEGITTPEALRRWERCIEITCRRAPTPRRCPTTARGALRNTCLRPTLSTRPVTTTMAWP